MQDIYLTETTQLADVVLPAAAWGEKTGIFTNVDRTVHLSEQAINPPGDARDDLHIFLDYARRMGFKDQDGNPLLDWSGPEDAFRAWQNCTRGRPCDYTGLSYDRLRGGSGIPWPCNDENPNGTTRLYEDAVFPTDPDYCEDYGHELLTGAVTSPQAYRASAPSGRAFFKAAPVAALPEAPDDAYPLRYPTGRTVYHFHTRTKTDRAPQLHDAASESWAEISAADAQRYGVVEGDTVSVASRRGEITTTARISDIRQGTVFVPFHYGYWDTTGATPNGAPRAANELTLAEWDPVSKQPIFKSAAVRLEKVPGPAKEQS